VSEFKRILQESNNHLSEDIPPHVLDELIHNADSFKDGVLTYDEFLELVRAFAVPQSSPDRFHLFL